MRHGGFPPGAILSDQHSQWAEYKEARDAVLVQLAQPLNVGYFIANHREIADALAPPPRKRIRQLVKLRTARRPRITRRN